MVPFFIPECGSAWALHSSAAFGGDGLIVPAEHYFYVACGFFVIIEAHKGIVKENCIILTGYLPEKKGKDVSLEGHLSRTAGCFSVLKKPWIYVRKNGNRRQRLNKKGKAIQPSLFVRAIAISV